jgi:DNA-binding MarR family transcriptional regulator
MTLRQIAVLVGVVETPGQSVHHIAERLDMNKPSVTRAVDVLCADGYVTRTVQHADRRQVSIVATMPGVALVRRMDGRAA